MPVLIKSVKEPQDIYILGSAGEHEDDECVIMGISDDYYTIYITSGEKVIHMETIGFVYVFTKEELLLSGKKIVEDDMFYEHGGLDCTTGLPEDRSFFQDKYATVLKNFSGDIYADILGRINGVSYLNDYDVTKNCYIYDHCDDIPDNVSTDDVLLLPEGVEMENIHVFEALERVGYANREDFVIKDV